MQDGKALQAGTSHNLGQNFSKAFGIDYLTDSGNKAHVYTTSWGVSTRLIGGMIMVHGDDDGLRVPPRVAPVQQFTGPGPGRMARRPGAGATPRPPKATDS